MKNLEFGFIQGRMTIPPKKDILQYFPKKNWKKEFYYAKKLNFNFIEYFGERNYNKNNPLWNIKSLKKINHLVKKNKLYNYSFCDDLFINNNLLKFKNLEEYYKELIFNLNFIKIKLYVLALFEKSLINKKNLISYAKILKKIAFKFKNKNIKIALETNLESKLFIRLLRLINEDNVYIVYDTGNRLKNPNLQYQEIIKLKKHIIHVHLKDKNFNGDNVILGTGSVNFDAIFMALKRIKFKGKFVFETNRGNNPRKTMLNNKNYILKKVNGFYNLKK